MCSHTLALAWQYLTAIYCQELALWFVEVYFSFSPLFIVSAQVSKEYASSQWEATGYDHMWILSVESAQAAFLLLLITPKNTIKEF